MKIVEIILAVWVIASVPIGVFVGKLIKAGRHPGADPEAEDDAR